MFSDQNGNNQVVEAEIVQENHYYPFGLNAEGLSSPIFLNKYQYNNKELNGEFGLEWNDYGARWYDASVGRFFSIDRFSEIYKFNTPYNYAVNNPILLIDINGDSIPATFYDKDGNRQTTIPAAIQAMFNNEYGVTVGYNSETGMLYYTGESNTTNTVSDEGKKAVVAVLGEKNSTTNVVFGYNLYYLKDDSENAIEYGETLGPKVGPQTAYIDLADFDEQGEPITKDPMSTAPLRSLNVARFFEHEFFGHGEDRIGGSPVNEQKIVNNQRGFAPPGVPYRVYYDVRQDHKGDYLKFRPGQSKDAKETKLYFNNNNTTKKKNKV